MLGAFNLILTFYQTAYMIKKTYYFRLVIYSSDIIDRKVGREVRASDSHSARLEIIRDYLSQGIFVRRIW